MTFLISIQMQNVGRLVVGRRFREKFQTSESCGDDDGGQFENELRRHILDGAGEN